MPKEPWRGYKRFCPLARGLDLVGERWTLVIVQELLNAPKRYSELTSRLPGIGTSVLADRLRKLDRAGVIERRAGGPGEPVHYALTDAGRRLEEPLRAFRQWGVEHLTRTACPDDQETTAFDVSFVEGIEALGDEEYELRVGPAVTTLRFSKGVLVQEPGPARDPALVVTTDEEFMRRWSAGEVDWDDGRDAGDVTVLGHPAAWPRMLAATGYVPRYQLETDD